MRHFCSLAVLLRVERTLFIPKLVRFNFGASFTPQFMLVGATAARHVRNARWCAATAAVRPTPAHNCTDK